MPGLAKTNERQFSNGAASLHSLPCWNGSVVGLSGNGFWAKHRNDVSYNQLQKFWSDLSAQARHELLRIDKQTLFEKARKNMYCSRCNGLLLEGFLQILMYGKSLQLEGAGGSLLCNMQAALKNQNDDGDLGMTMVCQDEVQDPSVHPWGGLTTTRDGTLTLVDCYVFSKSLKGLQIVFDSARARERERELLYPDACGGGGRGWISQGMMGYGRGHGARETCALHTARLSVDTLVDFWSALGEETRQSILRTKEEDFIERLMYRFDSKRFCRDCRRNVIREFKELKELKRMRREPRCTSWFCVADTAFLYEVSHDTVQADWHQTFKDNDGIFHYFEWAVGTGEGKSDILEFENVGTTERVKMDGLDLGGLNACYITLRAWKLDGRCTELCVKAHALKGQQCVHCRLVVGDGFVAITRGESIKRFFEHAEEAEEEEDDDSMDKDGNDMDGECSRPQKHAKSPELAREFLLDAAIVIFKEQVEKAFKEGTARQNSHSIFVCLALKLLEERVHVACKEIITLEKQMKLLEEEEKEKREEEERKERRRTKEREKKLRRKERLRGKEIDREKKCPEPCQTPVADVPTEELPQAPPDEQLSNGCSTIVVSCTENDSDDIPNANDENGSFTNDCSKLSHRKPKCRNEFQPDPTLKWSDKRHFVSGTSKHIRCNTFTKSMRNGASMFNGRMSDRCDSRDQHSDYRTKMETKPASQLESVCDLSKPYYRANINKYNHTDHIRENCGKPKSKIITKKVWEPLDSQRKYTSNNSDNSSRKYCQNGFHLEAKATTHRNSNETVNEEKTKLCSVTGICDPSTSDNSSPCQSEGETSVCSQNGVAELHKGEMEKKTMEEEGNALRSDFPVNLPKKSSENFENGRANVGGMCSQHHQVVIAPMHNQGGNGSIPFPVFQAPSTLGYFHQSPVSWAAAPVNGLIPFPHPNHHYVFSTHFGYGLDGNSPFMHYNPPRLNPCQVPIYQPVVRTNATNSKDQVRISKPVACNGYKTERAIPAGKNPIEGGKREKTNEGNSGFSLFHFGGPVALSTGSEHVEDDVVLHEKDDVEEYNLFAASNGIKFSFF